MGYYIIFVLQGQTNNDNNIVLQQYWSGFNIVQIIHFAPHLFTSDNPFKIGAYGNNLDKY